MFLKGVDRIPTNKPRAMITFNDKELYKAVDEYRFTHRFRSQNEAVMDLINKVKRPRVQISPHSMYVGMA